MNIQATMLYEQDFYGWIQYHLDLLRQGRLAELHIDRLIEELEGMAKRDRHELVSHFIILIAHLLKWQYQPEHRSGSWRGSVIEQRKQITRQLKLSPSLRPYLGDALQEAYPDAVDIASDETGLRSSIFPDGCEYTVEQLLSKEFYPE